MATVTLPMSSPVLFMCSDEEGKWSVTPEAAAILRDIDCDITVTAIAGN